MNIFLPLQEEALAAILERNNYSVDTVYDWQSALNYLEMDNYNGVILDIMMPEQMITWQNLFIPKNFWQESGRLQESRRHRHEDPFAVTEGAYIKISGGTMLPELGQQRVYKENP